MLCILLGCKKTAAKALFSKAAEDPERLIAYVMPWDTGMAPNITGGVCTLATCKPAIRRGVNLGRDWVVAVGAVKTVMHVAGGKKTYENWKDRLVYAMVPDERLTYDQYFHDKRFGAKIPQASNDPGDNLYYREKPGAPYTTVPHVNDIHRSDERMRYSSNFAAHDQTADAVLVANKFWYWGENAPHLADTGLKQKSIDGIMHARRGHVVINDPDIIRDVVDWLRAQEPGIHGQPRQRHLLTEFKL